VSSCAQIISSGMGLAWLMHVGRCARKTLSPVTGGCGVHIEFRVGSGDAGHAGRAAASFPGFWTGQGVEFGEYGGVVSRADPLKCPACLLQQDLSTHGLSGYRCRKVPRSLGALACLSQSPNSRHIATIVAMSTTFTVTGQQTLDSRNDLSNSLYILFGAPIIGSEIVQC
jgi:hypothetical protein